MNDPTQERTYRCPECLDGTPWITRVYPAGHKWAGLTYVVACDCDNGKAVEAGSWFRRIYRMEANGRRVKSEREEKAFSDFCRLEPMKARWLPDAVEQCRRRYEAAKKSTSEALQQRSGAEKSGGWSFGDQV